MIYCQPWEAHCWCAAAQYAQLPHTHLPSSVLTRGGTLVNSTRVRSKTPFKGLFRYSAHERAPQCMNEGGAPGLPLKRLIHYARL